MKEKVILKNYLERFLQKLYFSGPLQLVSTVNSDHKLDPVAMFQREVPNLKQSA